MGIYWDFKWTCDGGICDELEVDATQISSSSGVWFTTLLGDKRFSISS